MLRFWIGSPILIALVTLGCASKGRSPARAYVTQAGLIKQAHLAAFQRAAETYGIRADVLMAHAWLVHGFQHEQRPDPAKDTLSPRYGVMCLSDEQVKQGAKAAKLSEDAVRSDLEANTMAAASLVRDYLREKADASEPWDTNHYLAIVARLAEVNDRDAVEAYKRKFGELLIRSRDTATRDENPLPFAEELLETPSTPLPGEYPPMLHVDAHGDKHKPRVKDEKVGHVIIHTTESLLWDTIDFFAVEVKEEDQQTSSHYVVSSTGEIIRMVHEDRNAFHAGNDYYNGLSIGIEHEAWTGEPSIWFTDEMYRSSASLVCAIVVKHEIPMDAGEPRIIGHRQVPNPNPKMNEKDAPPGTDEQIAKEPLKWGGISGKNDPGVAWNWDYYLSLVNDCVEKAKSPPRQ